MDILKKETKSICPECYQEISAQIYEHDGSVFMNKECSRHGKFNILIEKDAFLYRKLMSKFDAGNKTAFESIMIPVTYSCNLDCSICYFANKKMQDLSLNELKMIISDFKGDAVWLSGGEPTLRKDLPEIIQFISRQGKRPVLLTNGIALSDRKYLKKLKRSGLKLILFSFNGFDDSAYKIIHGHKLKTLKLAALKNIMKERIKTTLSFMLVKGVNEQELRRIYNFYINNHRFFTMLKIRTAVFIGKYMDGMEQVYLSDIVEMLSKIIGLKKNELIEHCLSFSEGSNRPCQFNIPLSSLLFKGLDMDKIKNSFLQKIRNSFTLMSRIGFKNFLYMLRWEPGSDSYFLTPKPNDKGLFLSMFIALRQWPDKYRIDLNDASMCRSGYFIRDKNQAVPFCYGAIIDNK
ncbi:MAG: radical SAM protein [Candidatus Omnitrophica bacterium]|nr:radical SAM protein [Candidatus Omnitrophota bacterium]